LKQILIELMLVTNLNSSPLPIQNTTPVKTPIAKVQVVEYTIKPGDTLTKVAKKHNSSWLRLWQKNLSLKNPDNIKAGQKLTIPTPKEKLKNRPLPTTIKAKTPVPSQPSSGVLTVREDSPGNTYSPGYCTWYVKNRRPDLPNNLGNADTWTFRAAAQGIGTGSRPVPGAVGQQGMHVVYVESVQGNQMTISEMNYKGLYVTSSRTVSWLGWSFIY
jgi:surface antigen